MTLTFVPIFSAIEKTIGCRAYSGKMGHEDVEALTWHIYI